MKKHLSFYVCLMIATFLCGHVSADDIGELKMMVQDMKREYEQKIFMLESRIAELESQNVEIQTQVETAAASGGFDVEYVGRHKAPVGDGGLVIGHRHGAMDSQVAIGGYVDMEYRDLEQSDNTFRQHRWILNVAAQVSDRVRFNSEYEIEYGGPDAAAGDGEAKVEQAYVDYLINDAINVRGGAVLAPFARYNIYHDSDYNDLTDRPLVARDIVPTTWTEAAFGLFGEFEPVIGSYEDLLVNYEVYLVNGLDDGFSDTGFRGARNSLKTDNNSNKAVVGRMMLSPTLGHEVGLSGYWGKYDDANDNDLTGFALDLLHQFGPLELIGEYAVWDIDNSGVGSNAVTESMQGGYVQANYHFWPEFLDDTFLGRSFEDPTFTLVGRYGWAEIDDDGDAGVGDNKEERWTLGLNYRPIDNLVWKFEYQWNETDNESLEAGNANGFISSVALGF